METFFCCIKNLPKPYFTAIDYLQVVFYALELQIAEPDQFNAWIYYIILVPNILL